VLTHPVVLVEYQQSIPLVALPTATEDIFRLQASRIYRKAKSLKNYSEHILPVDPERILWRNHIGIPTMTSEAEN